MGGAMLVVATNTAPSEKRENGLYYIYKWKHSNEGIV